MRRLIPLFLLLLATAARAEDPDGTQVLTIEVGQSASVPAPGGSHLRCDDLEVVIPEFSPEGGLSLRALKPGTTLCGVRTPAELPAGLYRVLVVPATVKIKPAAKKSDGDAADAGTDSNQDADAKSDEASTKADAGTSY